MTFALVDHHVDAARQEIASAAAVLGGLGDLWWTGPAATAFADRRAEVAATLVRTARSLDDVDAASRAARTAALCVAPGTGAGWAPTPPVLAPASSAWPPAPAAPW